jgi:uroporphyrinogen decarboxylase
MTSRERVIKAIHHEEPDRVPCAVGGSKVSGVQADEYVRLARRFGIQGAPKVFEQFQMLARFEEPMRQAFHADIVELENPAETWGLANTGWKPWRTNQGSEVLMPGGFAPETGEDGTLYLKDAQGSRIAFMPQDALYFERTCQTGLSDEVLMADPDEWKKSIPLYSQEELRLLEAQARSLYEDTLYAVLGGFGRGGLSTYGLFAGHTIADWLMLLMTESDYAYSILRATAERAVENLALYLQAVGRYVEIVYVSGFDFGIQDRELFRPELFRALYAPNYRIMNDYVHSHSRAKTMFHSCGSIWNILPDFVEAGVDILNPVQTTAAHMDPAALKEKFGDQLTFLGGGAETQTVLPYGTPDEVKAQVKQRLKIFAPGGGFLFAPIHNIQPGVPTENIEAMIEAFWEYGKYPIRVE